MSFFSQLADTNVKVSNKGKYGDYSFIEGPLPSSQYLIHQLEKSDKGGLRIFIKGEMVDGPLAGKHVKFQYNCFGATMWKQDQALNDILAIAGAAQEFKDASRSDKEVILEQLFGGRDTAMDPKKSTLRGALAKVTAKPNAKNPKFQDIYFDHIDGQTEEQVAARIASLEAKGV